MDLLCGITINSNTLFLDYPCTSISHAHLLGEVGMLSVQLWRKDLVDLRLDVKKQDLKREVLKG